jgi:hypothetical protein
MRAASTWSIGSDCSAARTNSITTGVLSHDFAIATQNIAPQPLDSQWNGPSSAPTARSTPFTTPYCPLNIHAQRNAVTVLGSTQGSSEAARRIARPRIGWLSSSAQSEPSRVVAVVAITTKIIVVRHDPQK